MIPFITNYSQTFPYMCKILLEGMIEMIEMTLFSRHRIRNSSPGSLRPSTLPFGHGGSPQYWLSHVNGEETFFVSFKPPWPGNEPRTLAWKAAVLTTTLGPRPHRGGHQFCYLIFVKQCIPTILFLLWFLKTFLINIYENPEKKHFLHVHLKDGWMLAVAQRWATCWCRADNRFCRGTTNRHAPTPRGPDKNMLSQVSMYSFFVLWCLFQPEKCIMRWNEKLRMGLNRRCPELRDKSELGLISFYVTDIIRRSCVPQWSPEHRGFMMGKIAMVIHVSQWFIYSTYKLAIKSGTRILSLACKLLSTARNIVFFKLTAFIEVLTEQNTLVKYKPRWMWFSRKMWASYSWSCNLGFSHISMQKTDVHVCILVVMCTVNRGYFATPWKLINKHHKLIKITIIIGYTIL